MPGKRKRVARGDRQSQPGIPDDTASFNHRSRYFRFFKALKWAFAVLILLLVFLFAPFMAGARAKAIMPLNDLYCEKQSLPNDLGFTLEMPLQNMDFYPLAITFNDDQGMSSWLNKPVHFTVDYAIADFGFLSGYSRFYDFGSPLYNAYVGAYYLSGLGKPADQQTVLQVAAFDQSCLALPALGFDQAVFNATQIRKDERLRRLAGYDFERYDSVIMTNGPEHKKEGFKTGYILFGDPPPTKEQYPLREMAGRIYVTYLKDSDLTIGLYILAKDEATLDQIDQKIVSGTRLKWKGKR